MEFPILEWDPTPDEIATPEQNIGYKIYDVVWNLCDLANQLEIDLEPAFQAKCEFNAQRRWE